MSHLREELERQHAELDQALNDIACAAEAGDPASLLLAWSDFESCLVCHLDFEERELFPLVEPLHARALGALRGEHDRIRKLVAELGLRAELHTLRRDAVDELVELLRRHAEHEDRTLHHWLDDSAPEDTRRHLFGLLVEAVRASVRAGARDDASAVGH
jgi:hemerythrin